MESVRSRRFTVRAFACTGRVLRGLLTGCCVLLFFLSAAMWIRSLAYWDLLSVRAGRAHVIVTTWPDVVNVGVSRRVGVEAAAGEVEWRYIPSEIGDAKVGRNWKNFNWSGAAGNEWDPRLKRGFRTVGNYLTVPFWILMIVFGLPLLPRVVRWFRARWRRWRAKPGTCANCGYDLRASPGRCPECGAEAETTAA